MFIIFIHSLIFAYLALGVLYTEKIGLLNISIEGFLFGCIFNVSFVYLGYGIFMSIIMTLLVSLTFGGFFCLFL